MMKMNMKTKSVTVASTGVTVKVPTSAEGWQLYTTMRGASLAASRLTKAMEKALTAPSNEDAVNIMRAALRADRNYGATDTEPRYVAEVLLLKGRGGNFACAI